MNDKKHKGFSKEDLSKGRVIVTYGRSLMALVSAHSLGCKGVEVISGDSIGFTVSSFSKHTVDNFIYTDPEKDPAQYLDDIEEAAKRFKPDDDRPYVLMPTYKDTKLLAENRDRFDGLIEIAAPDYESIVKLNSKDDLARTLEAHDISAPQTWLPQSREELEDLAPDLDYPVIIKPYAQAGGRGIHKVDNAKELVELWDDNQSKYDQNSLVQAISDGEDYCLTGIFEQGELRGSMAYKNMYTFPEESGAGIMRETVDDGPLMAVASDLMKALEWNGIAEIDFLWDGNPDNTPELLEVNTRFWGGLFQSVDSGIDFPWMLYELTVLGRVETSGKPDIGSRTKMPYLWLAAAMKDIMDDSEARAVIEKQGKEALDRIKDGEILGGIQDYASYLSALLGHNLDFSSHAKKVDAVIKLGKSARSEVVDSDDPYAAFGVLFILDSLIRHGHLPSELKL